MALNFILFDPTYQTSNFYSAIAQIEKGGFQDGIYEIFEGARKYALFSNKNNIEILKLFFKSNTTAYRLIGESLLDKGKLLIIQTNNLHVSFPVLMEQAKISQEANMIIH